MGEPHPEHDTWMCRALALGARGGVHVRPNPQVGCVIVREGQVVGEGWHARAGGPHAEVVALQQAAEAARGATAYVTLEPCDHQGRTPPCTRALLAAGVARVVIGQPDPHKIAGGGAHTLRAAGVEVIEGVQAAAARALAEVFLVNTVEQRAFVRLKLAATLDGRTAATDGTSRWITGAPARALVHAWRSEADAVMVGSGTALADDPRLDVRHVPCVRPPLRVVLDRRLRLPPGHHLARTAQLATRLYTDDPGLLQTPRAAHLRQVGVELVCLQPSTPGDVAGWSREVMRHLLATGVHAVLVEGGAGLAAGLLRAGLVDRLELIQAPKLLGDGRPVLEGLGVDTIAQALPLSIEGVQRVGDDLHISAVRPPPLVAPVDPGP